MDRCIGCTSAHNVIDLGGDPWCWTCVVDGQYAGFVEAQMRVDAIVAERARRSHVPHIPTPRDDKRFKPAETA